MQADRSGGTCILDVSEADSHMSDRPTTRLSKNEKAYEIVKEPSQDLVEKVRGKICPAMMLAGSKAYFSWLACQGEEPDVGELVSLVYGTVEAQRICRDQQMGLEPRALPRLGV